MLVKTGFFSTTACILYRRSKVGDTHWTNSQLRLTWFNYEQYRGARRETNSTTLDADQRDYLCSVSR